MIRQHSLILISIALASLVLISGCTINLSQFKFRTAPACCIVINNTTGDAIGCARYVVINDTIRGMNETVCHDLFGELGNTTFVKEKCTNQTACEPVIDNCFGYYEGYGIYNILNGTYGCGPYSIYYFCDAGTPVLVEDCAAIGKFCINGTCVKMLFSIDLKPSFTLNETVSFDYTILSDQNQSIVYMPGIDCPEAPAPSLEEKTADLQENISLTESYAYITVNESIESQTCTAYLQILSPVQQREEKTFAINVTTASVAPGTESLRFEVLTCKDQACTEKSKVFEQNDTIYLDYDSEVPEPEVTAILTFPDDTQQQVTLPTSLTATKTGTYNLETIASKEGYEATNKTVQFDVVEIEAGWGTPGESPPPTGGAEGPEFNWLFVIISLIVIVVMITVAYLIKRGKTLT